MEPSKKKPCESIKISCSQRIKLVIGMIIMFGATIEFLWWEPKIMYDLRMYQVHLHYCKYRIFKHSVFEL